MRLDYLYFKLFCIFTAYEESHLDPKATIDARRAYDERLPVPSANNLDLRLEYSYNTYLYSLSCIHRSNEQKTDDESAKLLISVFIVPYKQPKLAHLTSPQENDGVCQVSSRDSPPVETTISQRRKGLRSQTPSFALKRCKPSC